MQLYHAMPVWAQNVLISGYGVHLRRLRYGPVGRALLAELRDSQWRPRAEAEARQRAMLAGIVEHAARTVPFYREAALPTPAFHDLEELRALPILTKPQVQGAGRTMIADAWRRHKVLEIHTGGTTGKPLAIYCDRPTLQRNYAFFSRFKESAGIHDGDRIATFAGRTLVPPAARAPYWRHNRAARTLLLSSYHIGGPTIDAYLDALERFRPALIDSYPSSLEPIARRALERGSTIRPRAVITSSETLFPEVRSLVERAFACRVFDHYGSAEMVALITQCDRGTYHVNMEFGVVELLRDGRPVAPGERGEIVATGFINPVMPLIRYATGDSAVLGDGRCACGRETMTLERIEGRVDDVVVTPEGRLVGRLDPIFKAVSSLYETRIVQDAPDHVRVEIVVMGDFPAAEEAELRSQLRLRLGPTMRIDIARVDQIPRTARGKLRTVVREI